MFLALVLLFAAEIPDARVSTYVTPERVMWMTKNDDSCSVKDADRLVGCRYGQVPEGQFWKGNGCLFTHNGQCPALLLDFGRELYGGLEIGAGLYTEDKALTKSTVRCRIRFGESVVEAMSDLKENGACNGHGMRDINEDIISLGSRVFGDTAFRFVRIDLLEPGTLQLEYVRAISKMRPLWPLGTFRSSDERLNRIYDTAVRTVHLCSQRFIWDGVKRDRLVWGGDMYPQIRTILAVYGPDPVVADSLDYLGAITPSDDWMCIPSYSMWWLMGVRDLWYKTGDLSFVRERCDYIKAMYRNLSRYVAEDGRCMISNVVLDWPTRKNPLAARDGHQALFSHTFAVGAELADALGDVAWAEELRGQAAKTALGNLHPNGSKSAAALLAKFALRDPKEMFAELLARDALSGLSPYYAGFVLDAMSAADERQRALETVRDYWGAMLDMGATSFWEGFDVAWTNGAVRIDELPVQGRKSIHADNGEFCYRGCRNSLCHGWGCSPANWLIENVLGIRQTQPGSRAFEISPFLGDLEWAEGSLALPNGRMIRVTVRKSADGTPVSTVEAPDDVKVSVK